MLVLDFHGGHDRAFIRSEDYRGREFIEAVAGETPASHFSQAERDQILGLVQAIFARSGVPIRVSDTAPGFGPQLTVRFAERLPLLDPEGDGGVPVRERGRVLEAFDGAGGSVAIFMDTADSTGAVAEAVAHEAGHAFGLADLAPGAGTVMAGESAALPAFAATPQPLADGSGTQNPVHHLRRAVLGESAAALAAEGLEPGSRDDGAARLLFDLAVSLRGGPLADLRLLRYPEGPGAAPEASLLAETVADGDRLAIALAPGEEFALAAASTEDGPLDIFLDFDHALAEIALSATAREAFFFDGDLLVLDDEGPLSVLPAKRGEIALSYAGTEAVAVTPATPAAILGSAADETLRGGAGDDTIFGNGGQDTVAYAARRDEIGESLGAEGAVTVLLPGGERDLLHDIARIALEDGTYLYDLGGDHLPATYRLYAAAFARVPDEAGLRFWAGQAAAGTAPEAMAAAFVGSAEFAARFGEAPSDDAFVSALFENVLGRAPDAAGRQFWLDAIATGAHDRADMLLFFADGPENLAQNADNYDDGVWVV
ncbi:hypothetical protein LNKW23_44740 [Paralimibaculum aggregatum]|uniref:DUF4214 domain-containing protein n=1 Tax=Paralimibaculum aggregatum TaxID=3036245 RepID=A0ABQ6LT71_9RHOB|nr:DUF4214 domain-containing protein [Limibaculum sp. NKW23]GMG85257.1 hypothetical protein LNKW23_44740 [Limibaculum sp. NKW23]